MNIRPRSGIALASLYAKAAAIFVLSCYGMVGLASTRLEPGAGQTAARPAPCLAKQDVVSKTICGDPELARRGQTAALLVAAARLDVTGRGVSRIPALQKKWVRYRDETCAKREDVRRCLADLYDWRLRELTVAALFRAPDIALAEMRRVMPESASVYEAVYRYATIENAEERARVVSQLIAPMVARIRDNPMGISVNEDPAAVLESDVTFSEFLQSASRQEHWMQLPCSALRLRPGLFSALDSMFGGFADATLIKSDCENMTPPLPALEQLRTAAIDAQPVCVGTIRYALAREFDKRYVAILLHRMELLKDDTPQNPTERKRLVTVSRFMAQHQTQVDAATLQMTAYYAHGFGVSPKLAERHATRAVQVMVGQAYQLCITG